MLSGCKLLQYATGVFAVIVVITIVLLLFTQSAMLAVPTVFMGSVNLGLLLIFYKVYMDCAKRQDILEKYKISVKPSELDKALAEKFKE